MARTHGNLVQKNPYITDTGQIRHLLVLNSVPRDNLVLSEDSGTKLRTGPTLEQGLSSKRGIPASGLGHPCGPTVGPRPTAGGLGIHVGLL